MVPLPEPVLSAASEAASAVSNAASESGAIEPGPESTALASLVETVWVSERSTSVNANVPEVGPVGIRSPPAVLVPAENATFCGPVVMSGMSLAPRVIVIEKV